MTTTSATLLQPPADAMTRVRLDEDVWKQRQKTHLARART